MATWYFRGRSSIRTLDALRSTSTRIDGEQKCNVIGRSGLDVAEANKYGACSGEMAWLGARWIKPLFVPAAIKVCDERATADAKLTRMMTAKMNCRSVASTFMIQVNSTRCSFSSQEKTKHSYPEMFYAGPQAENCTFLHEPPIGLTESARLTL